MLPDFSVSNFRCFRELTVDRLSRVNLIVGKNNVGKTALLESLFLYGTGGKGATVQFLLAWRDDFGSKSGTYPFDLRDTSLVHRSNGFKLNSRIVELGPSKSSFKLVVARSREDIPDGFSGMDMSAESLIPGGGMPAVQIGSKTHQAS